MSREPLTRSQEEILDVGMHAYLKKQRGPTQESTLIAHAELHSIHEIEDSLRRLRKAGAITTFVDSRLGKMWFALTSEDECKACERLRTTYQNPTNVMHTCMPVKRGNP